jgi:5-methylcytosine-specific restriction endonuclease McrA
MTKAQRSRRSSAYRRRASRIKQLCEHVCYYCGNPIKKKNISVDHLIQLCRGGENKIENLRICCKA